MNDLNTMLPQPRPLTLAGRTFNLLPLSINEISALQSWIRRTYPHPLDRVRGHLDGLTVEERKLLLDDAKEEAKQWPPQLGSVEAEQHIRSIDGYQEVFRMMLRKADTNLTDAEVVTLQGMLTAQQFFKVMEQVLTIAMEEDVEAPKDDPAPATPPATT